MSVDRETYKKVVYLPWHKPILVMTQNYKIRTKSIAIRPPNQPESMLEFATGAWNELIPYEKNLGKKRKSYFKEGMSKIK